MAELGANLSTREAFQVSRVVKWTTLLRCKPAKGPCAYWLPLTGDRKAKWWHSTFHNVTAMVATGVLGLPNAMVYRTWGPRVMVVVVSWMITLYTLWQMVEMHEMVEGKRFDRYHELGQEAFGENLGLWIVIPQQLIVEVVVDFVCMVTGGKSLQRSYEIVCKTQLPMTPHTSAWIAIFSSVHIVLAQLPIFNSIVTVSLAAAIMSLCYSTIAWAIPTAYGHRSPPLSIGADPKYHLPDQFMAGHVCKILLQPFSPKSKTSG